MGKRKTVWPTDHEVRLRFILLAVIDTASVEGVCSELVLSAHKLLADSPTKAQLLKALGCILAADEMQGFRFPRGSEAEEFMQALEYTAP